MLKIKFKKPFDQDKLIFILFSVIWIFIFISSGIITAGFDYFVDDHEIYRIHREKMDINQIFIIPFTSLLSNTDRLRPLYNVFNNIFSHLFGINSVVWYCSNLGVAITTSLLFYKLARKELFSVIESILFASIIVFGEQSYIYARFGTPETTANLLISLAFLFGSGAINKDNKKLNILFKVLFVFFSISASLNLEAYILMLPALAFFNVWSYSIRNKISLTNSFVLNKTTALILLSIFIILIAFIKIHGINGPGYAGVDGSLLNITKITNLFNDILYKTCFIIAIFINICYILLSYFSKNKALKKPDYGFYILCGLVIIPQLILYCKSGMYQHYLLPCVIGISLLTIYPLRRIKQLVPTFYPALILLLIIIVYNKAHAALVLFKDRSAHNQAEQIMIADLRFCLKNKSKFMLLANPYINYETIGSLQNSILAKEILNINHNDFYLVTYGSSHSDLKSDAFKGEEQQWSFLNINELTDSYNHIKLQNIPKRDLDKIHAILIFGAQEFEHDFKRRVQNWFNLQQFKYKYYKNTDIGLFCKKS